MWRLIRFALQPYVCMYVVELYLGNTLILLLHLDQDFMFFGMGLCLA